jgi:glycosyltransferase involved in cell wall biosynthesis
MVSLDVLPSDRYETIYNAVDLQRVEHSDEQVRAFKERYRIPKDRIVIVQVSWIIPEKGIPNVLKVAREVVKDTDRVHFVLVGEGAYREQYTQEAAAMGLSDYVTWTGLVQDPFGEGIYDAADIVLQLSHWEEVFGWMIAEGMAHGKPVVATRVGGIPEIIVDGETGFLVERDDIDTTAETLLRLIDEANVRHSFGTLGQQIVAKKFNLEKNVKRVLDRYGL